MLPAGMCLTIDADTNIINHIQYTEYKPYVQAVMCTLRSNMQILAVNCELIPLKRRHCIFPRHVANVTSKRDQVIP